MQTTIEKFDPTKIEVDLVDSSFKAVEFLRWLGDVRTPVMAIDVETDGFDWYDGRLRLVQFGTFNSGWAIPYEEYPQLVREALAIVDDRRLPVVGHNFKFDLHWLDRNANWQLKDWNRAHDSLLLASVLDSSGPKALKELSAHYVHPIAQRGQAELQQAFKDHGWTWGTVPTHFEAYWVYGVLDTILTAHLFSILYAKAQGAGCMEAYEVERAAVPTLFAMERKGMLVDSDHVRTQAAKLRNRIEEIDQAVFEYGITNLNSTDQLARAMIEAGIELTHKTKTGKWRMDKDVIEFLSATVDHPLMDLITEHRISERYASAYYDNFLRFQRSDGRVHPQFFQTQARTGRMSATEPAIQTLPRPQTDVNVRNSFIAPEGFQIISTDFTNVEARIFAHFAQEEGMLKAIRDGIDLHGYTAMVIYGEDDIVPKTDVRRQLSKNSLFCTIFGGGDEKVLMTANKELKGKARVTLEQASAARTGLLTTFSGIKGFQRQMSDLAKENLENTGRAFIRGIDGRILMMQEDDDRYYAFTNWLIQGTATVLLKQRLAVIHAMGLDPYMNCTIHDEVLAEVPTEDCEDFTVQITEAMNDTHQFSVAIEAESGKPAQRLGDAK